MSTASLNNAQKKDYAKNLFLHENLTQAELAVRTGVARKTIQRWMDTENWKGLRVSLTITREEQLRKLYDQLKNINDVIAERKEQRYATPAEADTITKIAGAIQKMESETGSGEIISVARAFTVWLRGFDLSKAQEIAPLLNAFIKDNLK
ncbi:MAG: DDE transposase family protein [Tannerellaceae bacterium]|jgi:transcriptional regulator with XRE-family HTH domain|nr:DDE transposase family protein [Tannerellaceae bacterium]